MARRRNASAFEDLIHIASRLPWWLSLIFAFIAWFWLHSYAISPSPAVASADHKQFGQQMTGVLFRNVATGLQYLLPGGLVLGAIISVIGRAKRRTLITDVARATKPGKTIEGISWQQFEQLTGEAFRLQGFSVSEIGGNGPDGGIDLILHKDREKYLVQCKQWRSLKVGVTVVREFYGVIVAEGAVGGFIVTSGAFTAEAQSFASGRNIRLVEGGELNRWIVASRSLEIKQPAGNPIPIHPVSAPQISVPACPVCSHAMQKRTAKRGANVGGEFWGCSQYPKCRGMIQL